MINKPYDHKVSLEVQDLLVILDSSCVVVGCIRDVQLLPNLYSVCAKEGFKGMEINYIKSMWV